MTAAYEIPVLPAKLLGFQCMSHWPHFLGSEIEMKESGRDNPNVSDNDNDNNNDDKEEEE